MNSTNFDNLTSQIGHMTLNEMLETLEDDDSGVFNINMSNNTGDRVLSIIVSKDKYLNGQIAPIVDAVMNEGDEGPFKVVVGGDDPNHSRVTGAGEDFPEEMTIEELNRHLDDIDDR